MTLSVLAVKEGRAALFDSIVNSWLPVLIVIGSFL